MSIHESGEMYLEAILVLTGKNGSVRSIDVSEYLADGSGIKSIDGVYTAAASAVIADADEDGEFDLGEDEEDAGDDEYTEEYEYESEDDFDSEDDYNN